MLSLFTANAVLYLNVGSARDGYCFGNGNPDDASTYPTPSSDPNNRGTLCTFYKYVSGPYQAANTIVALTPSYKESFEVYGLIPTQCGYCSDGASGECRAAPVRGKPRGSAREWVHAVIVIICSLLAKVTEVEGQGEIGHSFDAASNVFNKNARNGQSESDWERAELVFSAVADSGRLLDRSR